MAQSGQFYTLVIDQLTARGALLRWEGQSVLLPQREVPASAQVGDELRVFVYPGRRDELVATCRKPLAQVGEFALMRVVQVDRHGAFVDWGLDKDLLVPFAEQDEPLQIDRRCLVHVGRDRSGRLVGSTRVEPFLSSDVSALKPGQAVEALVWKLTDLGAKVILNQNYGGLIYHDELPPDVERGQQFKAWVKRVRDDGGVDVTLWPSGQSGRDEACVRLLEALSQHNPLPLCDTSSPEEIHQWLGLSKKAFKRAVGILYKQGRLELREGAIALKS
ncbi:MAG: GntR family transcriptional regulator [Desulfuromonadaceae bacterium]|nr:GntR family transcriptional regulator [Desulfuromonadaceae bacterium]